MVSPIERRLDDGGVGVAVIQALTQARAAAAQIGVDVERPYLEWVHGMLSVGAPPSVEGRIAFMIGFIEAVRAVLEKQAASEGRGKGRGSDAVET